MGSINEHIEMRSNIVVGNIKLGADFTTDALLDIQVNTYLPNQIEAEYRKQTGEHGICIDCQNPIPPARLEVVRNAIRCVDCQTIYEKKT